MRIDECDRQKLIDLKDAFLGVFGKWQPWNDEADKQTMIVTADSIANGNLLLRTLGKSSLRVDKQQQQHHIRDKHLFIEILSLCRDEEFTSIYELRTELTRRLNPEYPKITTYEINSIYPHLEILWQYGCLDGLRVTTKGRETLNRRGYAA